MEVIFNFLKKNYNLILLFFLIFFIFKSCSEYNSLYYQYDGLTKKIDSIEKVVQDISSDIKILKINIDKIKYDKEKIESIYIYDLLLKKREREINELKNKIKK